MVVQAFASIAVLGTHGRVPVIDVVDTNKFIKTASIADALTSRIEHFLLGQDEFLKCLLLLKDELVKILSDNVNFCLGFLDVDLAGFEVSFERILKLFDADEWNQLEVVVLA